MTWLKAHYVTIAVALAWLGKGIYDYVIAKDQTALLVDLGGFFSAIGVKSVFPAPAKLP